MDNKKIIYNYKPKIVKEEGKIKGSWKKPSRKATFSEMCKLYLHPGILMKEPSLVTHREAQEIYSFPLFTPLFCKTIIKRAEELNLYGNDRHKNYPTTDIELDKLGYGKWYKKVLKDYIHPIVQNMWSQIEESSLMISEDFFVKYSLDTQQGLSIHTDHSYFTILVTLNDGFEGGGTSFPRQNLQHKNKVGYATMHPGSMTHPHGGIPITKGERFILVSFCYDKHINTEKLDYK